MTNNLSIQKKIDSIRMEFEENWSIGNRPDFNQFLDRIDADHRESLLETLLKDDAKLLVNSGATPISNHYSHMDPDGLRTAERFLQSHDLQPTENFQTRADSQVAGSMPQQQCDNATLGPYTLIRKIGQGGMGAVYEAAHSDSGTRVALKVLPVVEGEKLHLFKREFRALANVNHPNLIGLQRLECENERWFFTMDLVDGTDFLSFVRPGNQFDVARFRQVLPQLVEAVATLHSRQIIHRDLKPSNVLVKKDGSLVVLDFGLVYEIDKQSENVQHSICGTPPFMAPEQFSGSVVAAEADWYAVGVMIYQSISGHLPYRSRNIQDLFAKKLNEDPSPLPDDPRIPSDLKTLCMKLLARDPGERPSAIQIAQYLSDDSLDISSPVKVPVNLVGRGRQLSELFEVYDLFRQKNRPVVAFIKGRSGEGKSLLAEHFIESVRKDSLVVLGGRCYERETVPFNAVDHLMDSLGSYLAAMDPATLEMLLPEDIPFLAQVFPTFQRIKAVAKAMRDRRMKRDEREVRTRAFSALRQLMIAVSSRNPVLLFIDDLQWGDAESAEVVYELIRGSNAPKLMVLGTYRSDEVDSSEFLKLWQSDDSEFQLDREIEVGPLTEEDVKTLVLTMIGDQNSPMFRKAIEVARETRGNPYLLVALLSTVDSKSGILEVLPVHRVVERKLDRLPVDARPILEIIAISGHATNLDEVSQAVELNSLPLATIYRMLNENLIRQIGDAQQLVFDTYHDQVRETVLKNMAAEYREGLHRHLGEVIENSNGGFPNSEFSKLETQRHKILDEEIEYDAIPRVFDLSYHFNAGKDENRAFQYSLLAAAEAKGRFALEAAIEQYRQLHQFPGNADRNIRFRASEQLAYSLLRLGRYKEAEKEVESGLKYAVNEIERSRLRILQAESLFEAGDMEECGMIAETQLRVLGVWVPKSNAAVGLAAAWKWCYHLFRVSFIPESWFRQSGDIDDRNYVIAELIRKLCYLYVYENLLRCLWSTASIALLVDRFAYKWLQAEVDSIISTFYVQLGANKIAAQRKERAQEYFENHNDARGLALEIWGRGITHYSSGEFVACDETLTQSIKLLKQSGSLWRKHAAEVICSMARLKRGEIKAAIELIKDFLEDQVGYGNRLLIVDGIVLLAFAANGRVSLDRLVEFVDTDRLYNQTKSTFHQANAICLLYQGKYEAAAKESDRAVATVGFTMCLTFATVPAFPLRAQCWREYAVYLLAKYPQRSRQALQVSWQAAKRGVRESKSCPYEAAYCLREFAEVLCLKGRWRRARRAAVKSCLIAKQQNAHFELAKSELCVAKIDIHMGKTDTNFNLGEIEDKLKAFSEQADCALVGFPEFLNSLRAINQKPGR